MIARSKTAAGKQNWKKKLFTMLSDIAMVMCKGVFVIATNPPFYGVDQYACRFLKCSQHVYVGRGDQGRGE